MAPSCNLIDSGLGDFSSSERKKPTIPKPKPARASVVLIQARVVRSRASCVRKLAMLVRLPAKVTRGSVGFDGSPAPEMPWLMGWLSTTEIKTGIVSRSAEHFEIDLF